MVLIKQAKKGNIPVIDSLRGIAALAVVLYHFVYTTTGYFSDQITREVFYFGKYGVQMFFVISGVVISLAMHSGDYSHKNWKRFLAKRFIRIEPPYLAAIAIGIIYLAGRNFIPGSASVDMTPSSKTVLMHFCYLVPFFDNVNWINPVFWTLAIEFQYYIMMCLFFPLFFRGNLAERLVFYLFCLVAGFFLPQNKFIFNWLPLFLAGILYVMKITRKISRVEFILVIILTAGITLQKLGIADFIAGGLTLLIIEFARDWRTRAFKFLGEISYSLYLLHSITGAAFVNFMSHRFTQPHEKFLVVLGGVAVSLISAYINYKLVEYPSRMMASKIKLQSVDSGKTQKTSRSGIFSKSLST